MIVASGPLIIGTEHVALIYLSLKNGLLHYYCPASSILIWPYQQLVECQFKWLEKGVLMVSQNLLNYDNPHVSVIVIMTSDSHTYVPHNPKGLLSSEQDPITGVLQYYNSLFKITSE
jgi:hypothetical protein